MRGDGAGSGDDGRARSTGSTPRPGSLPEEVRFAHAGLLPLAPGPGAPGTEEARLLKRPRVIDAARESGIEGLVSVVGIKYTTGMTVGARAVELAAAKARTRGCPPAATPAARPEPGSAPPGTDPVLAGRLARTYGGAAASIFRELADDPSRSARIAPDQPTTAAEILHAVREEMAHSLADVVLRRTPLGTFGHPGSAALAACAELLGAELGWDAARREREIGPGRDPLPAPDGAGERVRETADVETSSDGYASRFSGPVGAWMLEAQERAVRELLGAPGGATVLDVGGGHGQLALPLAAAGWRVTVLGSDPVCARRIAPAVAAGRVRFVAGDVLALPFPDRAFDFVVSVRLLPHCGQWPALVAELCRVARRAVIVDYPTLESLNRVAPALFGAKKRLEGNTRTFTLFTHREVAAAFAAGGYHARGPDRGVLPADGAPPDAALPSLLGGAGGGLPRARPHAALGLTGGRPLLQDITAGPAE